MNSFSYVTLLSDISYLEGVLVLDLSLKNVKSKYPLLVLVSKKIDQEYLEFLTLKSIQYSILDTEYNIPDEVSSKISDKRWLNTFEKLRTFSLIEFSKVIFIDCDVVVLRNIDHLFSCRGLKFATGCESVEKYKNWNLPNTGLIVLNPMKNLDKKIFAHWKIVSKSKYNFSDQDLVHSYFSKYLKAEDWELSSCYNAFSYMLDALISENNYNFKLASPDDKTIAVVHFAIAKKPWMLSNYNFAVLILKKLLRLKFFEIKSYLIFREYQKK